MASAIDNNMLVSRPSNGVGALRLLFASLVIVSHSPEMIDGNLRREPLHMLFHTLSFGDLAVDAFFLISGYLITASFLSSSTLGSFFWKRILRIYPAFFVGSLVCIFLVAPLAGAELQLLGPQEWGRLAYRFALLKGPEVRGAFMGQHYPALNGSAWTISYEFRCYILAAIFGLLGLYRRKKFYLAFTFAMVVLNLLMTLPGLRDFSAPGWFVAIFGEPHQQIRLLTAFMIGTCFLLFNEGIRLNGRTAIVAALALCGALFAPILAETALFLLGGYVLFWVAFCARWRPLHTVNASYDISYGVYIYAWPIGALLLWRHPEASPAVLAGLTFLGAIALGIASWVFVEKPAMKLKRAVGLASPKHMLRTSK